MLIQNQWRLPREITDVDFSVQIAKQELTRKMAESLMNYAKLEHSAHNDDIVYFTELVFLTPEVWREIKSDLRKLEMLSESRAVHAQAALIRIKLEKL